LIITTGFTDLSAEAHRNQTAVLIAASPDLDPNGTPGGLAMYGGVHSGFYLSGGGSLDGTVSIGRCVIPSSTPEGGAYVVTMTEPETVSFEPGDGVYTRIDLLCMQIADLPDPDAPVDPEAPVEPGASLIIVKGVGVTGTTTPAVPATPPNAIPLWYVLMKPSYTAAAGGWPANAKSDRRARLKLANQDRQPFSMAAGETSVTIAKNAIYGSIAISFPPYRFRVKPIVTCSLNSAPGGSNNIVPRIINETPVGASIYLYTADEQPASTTAAVTVNVNWLAVQMSEDVAAG
jgi:hypothetical protein